MPCTPFEISIIKFELLHHRDTLFYEAKHVVESRYSFQGGRPAVWPVSLQLSRCLAGNPWPPGHSRLILHSR